MVFHQNKRVNKNEEDVRHPGEGEGISKVMDKEDLRVAAGHQGRATSLSGQGRKLPETLLQDDEYAVISDAPGYFERKLYKLARIWY